ncbi:MAG: hypothetical protein L6R40_005480 [Gallowayella cf. fulva]|nr:MAG: hypothetical protein L6R40_005480 [Xanthomendoza cf. fulva]
MVVPQISVIGSLNIDLITRTSRMPQAGETLTANSFTYGSGGKGANQAVACARLSRSKNAPSTPLTADVTMTGCVGDDFFGNFLIQNLQNSGVQTSNVRRIENQKTGTAVIIVEEATGENRILITPGANDSVPADPVPVLGDIRADLLVLQLEIPLATVLSLITYAKKKGGIAVLLNPAPAVDLPLDIYKHLDHLIMNETEATMLSGWDATDKGPTIQSNIQPVCDKFHEMGVKNVIITLGANGVHYSTNNDDNSQRRSHHVPGVKVAKVVDTTAAGDTFVGAYAVAVVNGVGVAEAVEWANKAAAKTVEREGAQGAIPWLDEV